jgi:hypothetical protein
MKILVNFKSGFKQTFIVPKCMPVLEFRNIAREIGGSIETIEFSLPPRHSSSISRLKLQKEVFQLPDKR